MEKPDASRLAGEESKQIATVEKSKQCGWSEGQQVRVLATLSEYLGSSPSTHIM